MKIVISPAKSLNLDKELPISLFTEASFLKQAETIQKSLKKKKPKQLMELMAISEKLADLNWQRNQDWQLPFTPENSRPAIYTFDGEVYTGLDVYSLPAEKVAVLQEKLRILSGLYGVLKPLDLMQAYRLEMGTSIKIGTNKNLYEFWKKTLTDELNSELNKDELFVNLASNEYFSAVDDKKLKVAVITPEFKDYKDGKLKMISFFAKKARGLMVRYIIDTNAESVDDLKGFNYEGYAFDANLSDGNKLVFTR
ncbi:peroxide stress protein YaaA [Flavobacterium sp.]|uniref:peroxide stress protein YaaA n=1 Tax=Flavobacterium sp. TaxID=239 RepID=UPI003340FC55